MKKDSIAYFHEKVHQKDTLFPCDTQLELTYRCNLNCIHCYCDGLRNKGKELSTNELKRILCEIHQGGCLWLTFSGGEPLMRKDFLEIYSYAKKKGFLITLFTNGQLFSKEIIDYMAKAPPYSIEITLNGITRNTYEKITRTDGSFVKVIENIQLLKKNKLPLVIKTNLIKQNKNELVKIKNWVENTLGKPQNRHYFKYDPMIYPRLNGDRTPCKYRLTFQELLEVLREDQDLWQQQQGQFHREVPDFKRGCSHLYYCNSWMSQIFINPYGRLKFCLFSESFSADVREGSIKDWFNNTIPKVLEEKFKTGSACRKCNLRPMCHWCPARAYLETADEESPVEYYCQLTKALKEEREKAAVGR